VRESPEAEVVHSLKQHLLSRGLYGTRVAEVVVDSDGSYRSSRYAKALEPMASVPIDGFRPDLLCAVRQPPGSLVAGFEVKAAYSDWPKGLAQARAYRSGVHHSFLAIPSGQGNTQLLEESAREQGVGLLFRTGKDWSEVLRPADPRPSPSQIQAVSLAIEGVPLARRLQLNHPLNYLVVPYLKAHNPGGTLLAVLERDWPDLGTDGTRRHAIAGAQMLGLIDLYGDLTPQGSTAADLLAAVGFEPTRRPSKRIRLEEVAPAISAVVRSVLLHQPSVRLILETLLRVPKHVLPIDRLWEKACSRDEVLARALFLADPGHPLNRPLRSSDYNPSTVFKFKQVLWHAGVLLTKAEASAGGSAEQYRPDRDAWALDDRLLAKLGLGGRARA